MTALPVALGNAEEQAPQRPSQLGLAAVPAALYRLLSTRRRQLHLCLWLMLCGAVAELVTIGAVLPFLALIASADGLAASPRVPALLARLGRSGAGAIFPASVALCCAAAAVLTLLLT